MVPRKKKCDGGLRWGITHAFPYEPGFVLWFEVGEFTTSGELVSSSGELEYIGEGGDREFSK